MLVVLYDDTGIAAWSPSAADQYADHAETGRRWADLLAVAHHRAVFAHPFRVPYGAITTKMAFSITEGSVGSPGGNGHIPPPAARSRK